METLLILIAAAAVGGCIAAVVSWLRAKTAAADAATAREVAERHAAEAEERLAASERESRAARERAEAEIRTLIEARTKAEAAASTASARGSSSGIVSPVHASRASMSASAGKAATVSSPW